MEKGTQILKKNIADFSEWVRSAQKLVFNSALLSYKMKSTQDRHLDKSPGEMLVVFTLCLEQ